MYFGENNYPYSTEKNNAALGKELGVMLLYGMTEFLIRLLINIGILGWNWVTTLIRIVQIVVGVSIISSIIYR